MGYGCDGFEGNWVHDRLLMLVDEDNNEKFVLAKTEENKTTVISLDTTLTMRLFCNGTIKAPIIFSKLNMLTLTRREWKVFRALFNLEFPSNIPFTWKQFDYLWIKSRPMNVWHGDDYDLDCEGVLLEEHYGTEDFCWITEDA